MRVSRAWVLVMLLVVPLAPAVANARQVAADDKAVREVEDRRIKALVDDDFATLEAILADDLTYTHSSALVDTKASYLEALKTGKTKYVSVDRGTPAVRVYGPTAVLTGTADMVLRGQPDTIRLRYTLVYAKRDGRWQMVAWQSTRLPA